VEFSRNFQSPALEVPEFSLRVMTKHAEAHMDGQLAVDYDSTVPVLIDFYARTQKISGSKSSHQFL